MLTRSYGFSAARIGLYILPLAVDNYLGPLLLGRFFDTVGRKRLISMACGWNVFCGYCGAALLMLAAAVMELGFGVDAEGRALEQIADPLSG